MYQLVPAQPPSQARPSVRAKLVEALAPTLRMLDALTDSTFVFVLLEEVRRPLQAMSRPASALCEAAWPGRRADDVSSKNGCTVTVSYSSPRNVPSRSCSMHALL